MGCVAFATQADVATLHFRLLAIHEAFRIRFVGCHDSLRRLSTHLRSIVDASLPARPASSKMIEHGRPEADMNMDFRINLLRSSPRAR